jgi:hypothetical protein
MQATTKKQKMFGKAAERITKLELNLVFLELQSLILPSKRFECGKSLKTKLDFGDVDIVVEMTEDSFEKQTALIKSKLKHLVIKSVNHNPIFHCLYFSPVIKKQVHVDFIFAPTETFSSNLMYLDYSDFAAIMGIFVRKLQFNYGINGFFKVFVDKNNQFNYILLTRNLRDALKMLGYANSIEQYDQIQTIEDIVAFFPTSELFDSEFLTSETSNHSDRKRARSARDTAVQIRRELINLNKRQTQSDPDYYVKTLFPDVYANYSMECEQINSFVYAVPKYNGNFILANFPELRPGKQISVLKQHLLNKFGDQLENIEESIILSAIKDKLRNS